MKFILKIVNNLKTIGKEENRGGFGFRQAKFYKSNIQL